ncbi:hypothetical protein RRG08_034726 [Elysia crispata]|uniref:Uncharacterized protein n=1 Tax=Elysia crispata TaxID=231223 RepID=A0AAE0Y248_9GAST|nr:hypothetical protein RRG08_034726 [Elysia crispata]
MQIIFAALKLNQIVSFDLVDCRGSAGLGSAEEFKLRGRARFGQSKGRMLQSYASMPRQSTRKKKFCGLG